MYQMRASKSCHIRAFCRYSLRCRLRVCTVRNFNTWYFIICCGPIIFRALQHSESNRRECKHPVGFHSLTNKLTATIFLSITALHIGLSLSIELPTTQHNEDIPQIIENQGQIMWCSCHYISAAVSFGNQSCSV